MNKITISLLLVLTIFSLVLLSGCQPDNNYVKDRLSNSGEYVISDVWLPQYPYSSIPGTTDNIDRIQTVISPFLKLDFREGEQIDDDTFEQIQRGTYGLEQDRKFFYILEGQRSSKKWVLSINYENGVLGLILVETDGTVYYVNSADKLLMKTKRKAVNPDDYNPENVFNT